MIEAIENVLSFLSGFATALAHLIGEAIQAMVGVIMFSLLTVVNGIFGLFQLLIDAATLILPGLPSVPTPPEFVEAINWFFPLGTLLVEAVGLLTGYVVWMSIKWLYKKYGAL